MKVAIVGSRRYRDLPSVREFVRNLPPQTVIVSGGAAGVDTEAERAAADFGFICIVVKPAWKRGRYAGFERNQVIVDLADEIAAFWDGDSRGTHDTMTRAYAAGKPVHIMRYRHEAAVAEGQA